MDNNYFNKMFQVLVDNQDTDFIEFVRNNLDLLKDFSKQLGDELYKIPLLESDFSESYSFFDTIQIVKEFLGSINPEYPNKLEEFLNNGVIRLAEEDDEEKDLNYLDQVYGRDNKTYLDIKLTLNHNLEDAFALTHEFMHSTNLSDDSSVDRFLFTEGISVLYEFLLYDFLKTKNIKKSDNVLVMINIINHIIDRCDYLKANLELIEDNINNIKRLDEIDIADEESDESFYDDVDEMYKNLIDDVKYTFSGLISVLCFYNYKNGLISIENIESFNESIKTSENQESLRNIFISLPNIEDIKKASEFLNDDLFSYLRNNKTK